MIIGGVHWALATALAVVIHLLGMAWLSLGEPVRQIEPERTSEGIVVTLGRQAGSAGEAARAIAAGQSLPSADAEDIAAEQEANEVESLPEPVSEAGEPNPDEAAAEPATPVDTPETAEATPDIEPDAATSGQANAAEPPDPEPAIEEAAADAASPEREAVSAEPVVDAQPAAPRSVAAREAPGIEAVETGDARAVTGVEPRNDTGDAVPVEFAEAATVPEAPDTRNKTPEAETLWSGATPDTPEARVSSTADSPEAEPPAVKVAGTEPPAAQAGSVEGVSTVESSRSTMQLEAVEPGPAATQAPTVSAARQPAPEVKRVFEPETSEAAAPEVVRLQDLQEQEVGGTGVVARYAGVIKGWLQKNMHYPRAARLAGQEGDVVVRFIIDRDGNVQSIELEAGSGHSLLDREAREMIERGDPFPAMPVEMPGKRLEVRVPVSFHVQDETQQKEIPPIYLD